MPSKYRVKEYKADGIYHVYNRGVEKRDIFLNEKDYSFFLFLIKSYLTPKDDQIESKSQLQRGAFKDNITILAYALMPNHFHLVIKQKHEHDLQEFMRSVMTSYVSYFNKKYDRTGGLFQGVYKAILVESDDYLLHLTRYVHLNPLKTGVNPKKNFQLLISAKTSYADYLGRRNTEWVKPDFVLEFFKKMDEGQLFEANTYQEFVEGLLIDEKSYLGKYSID